MNETSGTANPTKTPYSVAWWLEHQADYDVPPAGLFGLKIVLLNGPPGSGKDTAGLHLTNTLPETTTASYSKPLKQMTNAVFGLASLPYDAFETVKNVPNSLFYGMTPRAAWILVAEKMVKPLLGADFFGKLLLRELWLLRQQGYKLVAITDSGFTDESRVVIDAVGADNVYLVRIHAQARNCHFATDSRGYLELPEVLSSDVHNDLINNTLTFLWAIECVAQSVFLL